MATATHSTQSGPLKNQIDTASRDQASRLPKDTAFQLVKNWRRREVLRYLEENEGQADVGDLAEHIASIKEDVPVEEVTSKQRKRVYVGLYQCHLRQLAEEGVVEYNKDRGTVRSRDLVNELTPYLRAGTGYPLNELSRGVVFGLIAVALLATVTAVTLGVQTSANLPLVAWGGVSTAGFVVAAMQWARHT